MEKQKEVTNSETKYPPEIKELIREKRRVRKRWQQSRAPQHKTHSNHLCNKLKKSDPRFQKSRDFYISRRLDCREKLNYSLWKAMKDIKKPQMQSLPIRKNNGEWAKRDKEKADLFAKQLGETFKPFDGQALIEDLGSTITTLDKFNIKSRSNLHAIKKLRKKQGPWM